MMASHAKTRTMPIDSSYFGLILQLGIGGVAVVGIIYITLNNEKNSSVRERLFVDTLIELSDKHAAAMKEREDSLRQVETSMRNIMAEQLTKNTIALIDVTKIFGRVARQLDNRADGSI